MGKMIFTVIGAVAELERSLIRERVMMGLDRARRQGKRLGRPRAIADAAKIRDLQNEGYSLRMIAKRVGLSHTKVANILKQLP